MSQNVSYHYVLFEIVPTVATFTKWVSLYCCSVFLHPPFYTSTSSFLHQTLLLPSKTPFSSSSLQPTCENFHPPRLCILPEGRLSSFPYLPLSLSPLSFPRPSYSLYHLCANSHRKDTPAQTHSPLSFVSTVSLDGKKLPYVPTYRPLSLLYVKSHHTGVGSASALTITTDIKESSQTCRVTPLSDGKLLHQGGKMWCDSWKPSLNIDPNH